MRESLQNFPVTSTHQDQQQIGLSHVDALVLLCVPQLASLPYCLTYYLCQHIVCNKHTASSSGGDGELPNRERLTGTINSPTSLSSLRAFVTIDSSDLVPGFRAPTSWAQGSQALTYPLWFTTSPGMFAEQHPLQNIWPHNRQ